MLRLQEQKVDAAAGERLGGQRRAGQGFQFLTAGSDAGFLLAGARAGLQTLGR